MDFGYDVFAPFADWWNKYFLKIEFTLFGLKTNVAAIFIFCGLAFILIKVYWWLHD